MRQDLMHLLIYKLVEVCPTLRRLDHDKYHEKRRDTKIIVLKKSVDDAGQAHLGYDVERPEGRYVHLPSKHRVL